MRTLYEESPIFAIDLELEGEPKVRRPILVRNPLLQILAHQDLGALEVISQAVPVFGKDFDFA
jgi:hypothetical protein